MNEKYRAGSRKAKLKKMPEREREGGREEDGPTDGLTETAKAAPAADNRILVFYDHVTKIIIR